jgi:putative endonuclease
MDQDNRTQKRKVGDLGEDIACTFLVKRGFVIVTRNYLRKWGEIDIIARKGQKLHFVEVKTVSHLPVSHVTDGYRPEDNLHLWKLDRLRRTIQTYLLGYEQKRDVSYETEWQFDVITVYFNPWSGESEVEYMEDVIL